MFCYSIGSRFHRVDNTSPAESATHAPMGASEPDDRLDRAWVSEPMCTDRLNPCDPVGNHSSRVSTVLLESTGASGAWTSTAVHMR